MRYGDLMLDLYSEDFPGPNNKQIPIRPDETFRVLLVRFSYYLFGFRDEDATTKMCRAAIRWYIKEIKKAMEDADSFEDELMEIKNSVVKNRVDIGN